MRLHPGDDATEVTAAQIRDLVDRLQRAGQWHPGQGPVLFVLDSSYDLVRLSWLLAQEPVVLLGRLRTDRVMYGPGGTRDSPRPGGRPPGHGARLKPSGAGSHPAPVQESATTHRRYGRVRVPHGHPAPCPPRAGNPPSTAQNS